MWGKELVSSRKSLVLSVLCFLLCSLVSPTLLYADVTLTDEEAQMMLDYMDACEATLLRTSNELNQSMEDLQLAQSRLDEAQTELMTVQTELSNVQSNYEEQVKYYEEQLNEAEKKNKNLKATVAVTTGSSASLLVVVLLCLLL